MSRIFNVHIYREMRLFFPSITAESHEAAARIASSRPTEEAEYAAPCDGEDLSALIDLAGDEEFTCSRVIDFEPERLRKGAPLLLEALRTIAAIPLWGEALTDTDARADYIASSQYDPLQESFEPSCDTESTMLQDAVETARAALEAYKRGRPLSPPPFLTTLFLKAVTSKPA